MVDLASGILDCRENILAFEIRIIFKNFFEIRAGVEKLKDVAYSDTHTTDTRTTTTLAVIDRDATEDLRLCVHTSVPVYLHLVAPTHV